MATTEEILNAARALGKLITQHPATQKFQAAVKKLDSDVEAQRTLNDYSRHLSALAQKEAQGQPIEVEDKHRLDNLQSRVIRNPLLRDLQITQMDYLDLMRQVDEAMLGDLAPPTASPTMPHLEPSPSLKH